MKDLNAPVPGMSLTGSPQGLPFERPPQHTDPEDALIMHLDNLAKPEVIESVFDVLDMGLDLYSLTQGILRSGVAAGRHSIDVSMIIGPVIHEYIKSMATAADVPFEEGFEDPKAKAEVKKTKKSLMTKKVREKMKKAEEVSEEVAETREEAPTAPEGRGLVQRPPALGVGNEGVV